MTSPRPIIVWFRDDLRLSDHPALHAAAKDARAGCLPLRARRGERRAPAARRRGALVAGAVAARPAGEPAISGGLSWCCGRERRPEVIAALAREIGRRERCTGTRSRRRRIGPWPIRSPRRLARSMSSRSASPAICWSVAEPDPQQGEPRPARVHAVLAAGAGAGRSAKTAAGAEEA